MKNKVKKGSFQIAVLNNLSKDDKVKLAERAIDQIEDYKIECEAQISQLEVMDIPKTDLEIKSLKRKSTKAEKDKESAYLNVIDQSFASYIETINTCEKRADELQEEIEVLKEKKDRLKESAKRYKAILEKFNS